MLFIFFFSLLFTDLLSIFSYIYLSANSGRIYTAIKHRGGHSHTSDYLLTRFTGVLLDIYWKLLWTICSFLRQMSVTKCSWTLEAT